MKTKRERDTCLYFAYNNSLICSVQGAYVDYVTNMLYMFLLEYGVCKGFEGLLQKTYFLCLKTYIQTPKCLIHPYKMPALGLGKTEGMFHSGYGASLVARRQ